MVRVGLGILTLRLERGVNTGEARRPLPLLVKQAIAAHTSPQRTWGPGGWRRSPSSNPHPWHHLPRVLELPGCHLPPPLGFLLP